MGYGNLIPHCCEVYFNGKEYRTTILQLDHRRLLESYESNDDFEEQNLNAVILLNPKNEEALYLLTLLRIKKSDYDESQQLLEKFKKVCNKICDKKVELISRLKSLETN